MRTGRVFLLIVAAMSASVAVACSDRDDGLEEDNQEVSDPNDLYGQTEALPITLSAPLTTLFTRLNNHQVDPPSVKDGDAGGVVEYEEPGYSEPGQLVFKQGATEKKLDVRVFVRGESSLSDCPFPKLKLEFTDKEQLKGTPFKTHGKVRLNTHCGPGEEKTRSKLGRVLNGIGPVREDLAYRLVRAAGIPTYLTRVAKVVYDDTASHKKTNSFAMFMESGDDAAQRFAKSRLIPEDGKFLDSAKGEVTGKTTPTNDAEVIVAEAIVGNRDFDGGYLHNVDAFGVPKGPKVFKIAQDFDLGAITLGDVAAYWKGSGTIDDARAGLVMKGLVTQLKSKKNTMYRVLDDAEKDAIAAGATKGNDSGFAEAKRRLDGLFELPEITGKEPVVAADAGAGRDF